MKNIKIAIWAIPSLLTILWLAATRPFPEPARTMGRHRRMVFLSQDDMKKRSDSTGRSMKQEPVLPSTSK